MPDTIKLPGLGETKKPVVVLIVVAGVGLAFVVARQRQNAAANAVTVPADSSTLDTSTSAGIDPDTGLPIGSLQDQEALSGQFGGGLGFDGGLGLNDTGFSTSPFGVPSASPSGIITTNADWDAQALQNVEAIGYGSEAAATALARYLGKLTLSASQAQIVQVAVAETGPPPVGTFAIRSAPNPPKPAPEVKVPETKGLDVDSAVNKLHAAGFKTHSRARKPGTRNIVTSTSPAGGTKTHKGATITVNFKQENRK